MPPKLLTLKDAEKSGVMWTYTGGNPKELASAAMLAEVDSDELRTRPDIRDLFVAPYPHRSEWSVTECQSVVIAGPLLP